MLARYNARKKNHSDKIPKEINTMQKHSQMKIENVINGKSTKRFLVRSVYAAREHMPTPATGALYKYIYMYIICVPIQMFTQEIYI